MNKKSSDDCPSSGDRCEIRQTRVSIPEFNAAMLRVRKKQQKGQINFLLLSYTLAILYMLLKHTVYSVDTVVIGAGVIGLAVARSLAKSGREVLILERNASIGQETSSRNSQVIHAGLYYPQRSFKAKFCVEGRRMLYQYCRERSVDVQQCGKLIVATSEASFRDKLVPLYHQALRNGVTDVKLLTDTAHIADLEPHLSHVVAALWSPSTGIVDSHHFLYSLLADAEAHGATLALQSAVEDSRITNGVELQVGGMWIACRNVVNAAGLWAHQVASLLHQNHPWQPPKQYCKSFRRYL
jgi:L-2-hydroxyglutarate oxidase LhgO